MNDELNNLIDDILKEKLKLHYENEELEAQGKLIKELCKEIERLYSIIKEAREHIHLAQNYGKEKYLYINGDDVLEILDKVGEE